LAQEVANAVLLADSDRIEPQHLGESLPPISLSRRTLCSLKEDHYRHVAYTLKHSKGDCKKAAEILEVSVRQVQRLISQIKQDPSYRALLSDI
jgi:hypothetical protein